MWYSSDNLQISIHALVKRATADIEFVREMSTHFNPRPREEGDSCLML